MYRGPQPRALPLSYVGMVAQAGVDPAYRPYEERLFAGSSALLAGDERIRTLVAGLKTRLTTLESPMVLPDGSDPSSPI